MKKRQRRLADLDEIVLSLYAKGVDEREIPAHFAEIQGPSVIIGWVDLEQPATITGQLVALASRLGIPEHRISRRHRPTKSRP